MSHQVFIERCRDSELATAESLARAIAARYQIDPQQILGRLKSGRFRVKANLELAAAQQFMTYLESEGALCSIVDSSGQVVARSAEVTPTPPPPSIEEDDFLPLHTPPPPASPGEGANYESGLSAGFSGGADSQELGALADIAAASSGSLKLSTLDGVSSEKKKGPAASSLADVSDVEAFLPPEALAEGKLELADDDETESSLASEQAPVSTPPPQMLDEPYGDEDEVAEAAVGPSISPKERVIALLVDSHRGRLAVGVFLAFVIGFLLSSTIASGMEDGQYAKAVSELESAYIAVDTIDAWEKLDAVRTGALESLERRRKNIVITSLLVWLVAGGLLLFLWMRVINWERVRLSLAPDSEPA